MRRNASSQMKTVRLSNAVAAGVTTINSSVLDTQGANGARFLTAFGAIVAGAVTSVKIQQGNLADGSDMADLEGTSITVADDDDNQVVVHEIHNPRERYLRVVVLRATQNSTVDAIVAELIRPRVSPTSDDTATVVGREIHVSPAEGTA